MNDEFLLLVHYRFTAFMQRISNTDKIQNDSLTPDEVLNLSMYGSLCASMIIGKLRNRQVDMVNHCKW